MNSASPLMSRNNAVPLQRDLFRATWIRGSLWGEYLSLLIFCHSLFGSLVWGLNAWRSPFVAGLMVLSGLWMAFRSMGGAAGDRRAAGMSAGLLGICIGLSVIETPGIPLWLKASLVSPFVWTAMAVIICVTELVDLRAAGIADLTRIERRKWDGRALRMVLIGLFLIWGVGVPLLTLLQKWNQSADRVQLEELSFVEHVGFRCGEALVTACFVAVGANIGSFLNVVVWRLPQRISVIHGDSRCPACGTRIAGRDNIPIFGWLALGGQCRTCQASISSRYPIVEAITAGIFLILYLAELISGGVNLPFRDVNLYRGVLWIIMYPKWDLIGLYAYHCLLMSLLLVLTLLAMDRQKPPARLVLTGIALLSAAALLFPRLLLVPLQAPWAIAHSAAASPDASVVMTSLKILAGVAAGFSWGWLTGRVWLREKRPNTTAVMGLMNGVALGWQAVFTIGASVWLVLLLMRLSAQGRNTGTCCHPALIICVLTMCHHVLWSAMWA